MHAADAGVQAHPHTAQGRVVDEIDKAAGELGADLVVVGSRGLGGISGALLGSVSRALITRSHVPVTVVRSAVHAHA
jgi:nucleotide-binding universal stress UspA family protein